ncbi:MAG: hypothetical protein ABJB74_17480 [Gemmatimonas sp.]
MRISAAGINATTAAACSDCETRFFAVTLVATRFFEMDLAAACFFEICLAATCFLETGFVATRCCNLAEDFFVPDVS